MSAMIDESIRLDREARIRMAKRLAGDINAGTAGGLPGLRRERTRKYSSQKRFCEETGFDRQTYASWETGRHWPSARAVTIIAAALDCTIEDLFLPGEESEG